MIQPPSAPPTPRKPLPQPPQPLPPNLNSSHSGGRGLKLDKSILIFHFLKCLVAKLAAVSKLAVEQQCSVSVMDQSDCVDDKNIPYLSVFVVHQQNSQPHRS